MTALGRPQPIGETLRFMQRLWDLAHALDVGSKRMARTLGVTGPQRLVIRVIGQQPRCTAREIAATLNMHPSTLTGVLARLEAQHAIKREIDAADRRRSRFQLTPRGARIDRTRRGTIEAAVRRALARAEPAMIEKTSRMIELIVDELSRLR
jgi:DNA-binding MarR family transcriptional regulator